MADGNRDVGSAVARPCCGATTTDEEEDAAATANAVPGAMSDLQFPLIFVDHGIVVVVIILRHHQQQGLRWTRSGRA